jgi:cadmium resistance protein CadD (predicted permease)
MGFFQLILKSIFAFVIVNIDEFLVLLLFFTKAIADHHSNHDYHYQADDQLTVFHIIAGQLIGFTIIIGISLFGSLFGLFIPYRYISLIGFVPLLLGCFELFKVLRFWWKRYCSKKSRIVSSSYTSPPPPPPPASIVPISPVPHSRLSGTDVVAIEEILVNGQDGIPPSKLSTTNSNHDRRTSFNTISDFELQYETISSLNPLSSVASHRLSSYPPRHDYSSYQNPPFDSSDHEKDEKTGLLIYSSDDEIEQGRSSTSSEDNKETEAEIEETPLTSWFQEHYQSAFHKNIFYVSMILLGDGSEEIAVFLPILSTAMSSEQGIMSFSSSSSPDHAASSSTFLAFYHIFIVLFIIFIWYIMIFCQCYLAYLLIVYHYESYGKWISRYSKNIIPFVLIGLGCLILRDSILLTWIDVIVGYCQQRLPET